MNSEIINFTVSKNNNEDITFNCRVDSQLHTPLTSTQRVKIYNVLQESVEQKHLSSQTRHEVAVTMLGADSWRIVIDNKITIQRGNEVHYETSRARSIFSSVKNLFRSMTNFFYQPAFPHPAHGERKFEQAVQEDYRSLRKGLEKGEEWVTAHTDNQEIQKNLREAAANAKKIEKALASKKPKKSLEQLSTTFIRAVGRLQPGESLTMPTGYMTSSGTLQPMMLQFSRREIDGESVFRVEIFADSLGGARIKPTQVREATNPTVDQELAIINFFLEPLTAQGHDKQLRKAIQPSAEFETLYRAIKDSMMADFPAEASPAKPSHMESEPPVRLDYFQFISGADSKFGNVWTEPAGELHGADPEKEMSPSKSPIDRVTKWVNHVLSGPTKVKLSDKQRADFIFWLTQDWVEDQLKQIDSSVSLEGKEEIYQDCLDQINHVLVKVLDNKVPLEHCPDKLRSLHQKCERQLQAIEPKLRKQKIEIFSEGIKKRQRMNIRVLAPEIAEIAPRIDPVAPVTRLQEAPWRENFEALKMLFSQENLKQHHLNKVVCKFEEDLPLEEMKDDLPRLLAYIFAKGDPSAPGSIHSLYQLVTPGNEIPPDSEEAKRGEEAFQEFLVHLLIHPDMYEMSRTYRSLLSIFLRRLSSEINASHKGDPLNQMQQAFLVSYLAGNEIPTREEAVNGITEFQEACYHQLRGCHDEIQQLMESSLAEPNIVRKKRLLQEAQEKAAAVIALLPSPTGSQVFGVESLWEENPHVEMQDLLYGLQQIIWESQMKLGQSELSPFIRLQFIKAQSIQQALLLNFPTGNGIAKQNLHCIDYRAHYAFLSQDLTAELSRDPAIDRDILMLSQFSSEGLSYPADEEQIPYLHRTIGRMEEGALQKSLQRYVNQISKAKLFSLTSADPDFRICGTGSVGDHRFFAYEPDALLHAGRLTLQASQDGSNSYEIISEKAPDGHVFARVYPEGHPQRENGDPEDVIPKKKAFLPVVATPAVCSRPPLGSLWEPAVYDTWIQYVGEISRVQNLEIPKDVLLKLFLIRNAGQHNIFFCYDAGTAVNALHFITDPSNAPYLGHSYIQKFIRESLFGSFLMQQALSEHPDAMFSCLQALKDRIEETENPAIRSFLLGVASDMAKHADSISTAWKEEGVFSPYHRFLPIYKEKTAGGLFYRLENNFVPLQPVALCEQAKNTLAQIQKDHLIEQEPSVEENPPILNQEFLKSPLKVRLQQITGCREFLQDLLTEAHQNTPSLLNKFIFQDGVREVNAITNPSLRKQMSRLALEECRRDFAEGRLNIESLTPEPFAAIAECCREVNHVDDWAWFHSHILPAVDLWEVEARGAYLSQIAHSLFDLDLPQQGWQQDDTDPHHYRFDGVDGTIEINLYNLSASGREQTKQVESTSIPASLLKRDDIQKALKAETIKARVEDRQGRVSYHWENEGQQFVLSTLGGHLLSLTRTIEGTVYTFKHIEIDTPSGFSEALLAEHGVWMTPTAARIFTQGQRLPSESTTYEVEREEGFFTRIAVVAGDNEESFVSSTSWKNQTSPLLFAAAADVIPLLDARGRVMQMRLKDSSLRFVKENRSWNCYDGGKLLGRVEYPENEKAVVNCFGAQWDQFVIPLKNDGAVSFVMLPYKQSLSKSGKMAVDKTVGGCSLVPEEFSVKEDGTIQGSAAGHLYLAHALLLQANASKNPGKAREIRAKAQAHLAQLRSLRPSSDLENGNLSKVMRLIEQQPVVSLTPMPSPEAIAMGLRLALQVNRACEISGAAIKRLPSERFSELERISKLYSAYLAMEHSQQFKGMDGQKVTKGILLLTPSEQAALASLKIELLASFSDADSLAGMFGNRSASLETQVQIDRVTQVDPHFVLSLLRVAKPLQDPPVDVESLIGPLHLEALLQNFWNYFHAIKTNGIAPDKLLFLFQESILPTANNEQEAQQLKALDKQARQFLLAMAELSSSFGPSFNPQASVEALLQYAKAGIEASLPEELIDSITQFNTGLALEIRNIRDAVLNLEAEIDTKDVSGKQIAMVNVRKLSDDVKTVSLSILTFSETLGSLIEKAEKLVEENRAVYTRLMQEYDAMDREFRSQFQIIESFDQDDPQKEDLLNESLVLRDKIAEKEIEIKGFTNGLFTDPLSNREMPRSMILDGSYQNMAGLAELKNLHDSCIVMKREIRAAFKEASRAEAMLNTWQKMEELLVSLQEPFSPHPDLKFPEKPTVLQNLKTWVSQGEEFTDQAPREMVTTVIDAIGVLEALKLAPNLWDYKKNKLIEKLGVFAPILEGLALLPRLTKRKEPITAGTKSLGAHQPLPIALDSPAARLYLSPEQSDKIAEHLESHANPAERKTFLKTLASALGNKEEAVGLQLLVDANLKAIAKGFASVASLEDVAKPPRALVPPPDVEPQEREFIFGDFFSNVPIGDPYIEHQKLVQDLRGTVTDGNNSTYAQDLLTGINRLENDPPIPYGSGVNPDTLEALEEQVKEVTQLLKDSLQRQQAVIIDKLMTLPITALPKELQRLRIAKSSDQEFLQEAYKQYRLGAFCSDDFPDKDVDRLLTRELLDATHAKALTSARNNAKSLLGSLKGLKQEKEALLEDLEAANGAEIARVQAALRSVDIRWGKESSKLRDCLERCQDDVLLTRLKPSLQPHIRKIVYLQYRLGVVLRQNQLSALEHIISNSSYLEQMRMGLGKTSVIMPFALEILASDGKNAIGIVPRSQFQNNFLEMDDTTRVVFELCGSEFLFSRQDAPQPITVASLCGLSQKCADFFKALEEGRYVLTTIESKASLDDKIVEIERARAADVNYLPRINKAKNRDEWEQCYQKITQHQMALDMLYRVQSTFSDPNTRLIIDEVDQVARATYSVNSELGTRSPPAPILLEVVGDIFDILQAVDGTDNCIRDVRNEIFQNNQLALPKEAVDASIKEIGKIWMEAKGIVWGVDGLPSQEAVLEWLCGKAEESPFANIPLDNIPNRHELKVLRKALNSGFRGALGLKIGLTVAFDPLRQAIGVPAQQGLASETTKYSDPLMQLLLASTLAMFSPQGEEFLQASAAEVYQQVANTLEKKTGVEPAEEEQITQVDKEVINEACKQLQGSLEERKEGSTASLYAKLFGVEPWQVFLRAAFAKHASQQMIYVTEHQVSRSVQDALRGCNIIGLTGTATRNVFPLMKEEAYQDTISSGRACTAEVLYRIAKASPNGINTPVRTYSLDSQAAFEECKELARRESGYNFLINQAAVCDSFSQEQIVQGLHNESQRPIIYMDGKKKYVLIGNTQKLLSRLSAEETQQVQQAGFYYYHAPYCRGTDFVIPIGSKGALMLSPKVGANDRDQAAYRARELGDGHEIELFISEEQYGRLSDHEAPVTIGQVFKENFEQTESNEKKEDLSAFHLSIGGILTHAADSIKASLNLADPVLHLSEKDARSDKKISRGACKAFVFGVFEKHFIESTNNDVYLKSLDKEFLQSGTESTKDNVLRAIRQQKALAVRWISALQEGVNRFGEESVRPIITQVEDALRLLEEKEAWINEYWDEIAGQYSETVPKASSDLETAEVEAEQEAQEEQEAQTETPAAAKRQRRALATEQIFTKIDKKCLEESPSRWKQSSDYSLTIGINQALRTGEVFSDSWDLSDMSIHVMQQMNDCLAFANGGRLASMELIVVAHEEEYLKRHIVIADPQTAHQLSANFHAVNSTPPNTGIVTVSVTSSGGVELRYKANGTYSTGYQKQFETELFQGQLLASLLFVGVQNFTTDQWELIKHYWDNLSLVAQNQFKDELSVELKKNRPKLFTTVASKLKFKEKEQ